MARLALDLQERPPQLCANALLHGWGGSRRSVRAGLRDQLPRAQTRDRADRGPRWQSPGGTAPGSEAAAQFRWGLVGWGGPLVLFEEATCVAPWVLEALDIRRACTAARTAGRARRTGRVDRSRSGGRARESRRRASTSKGSTEAVWDLQDRGPHSLVACAVGVGVWWCGGVRRIEGQEARVWHTRWEEWRGIRGNGGRGAARAHRGWWVRESGSPKEGLPGRRIRRCWPTRGGGPEKAAGVGVSWQIAVSGSSPLLLIAAEDDHRRGVVAPVLGRR